MQFRLIDYALWFASPLIQLAMGIVMYRGRLHEDYFWFFGYTIVAVVSDVILFILHNRSYTLYYNGYYVTLGLCVFLGAGVLQEVVINASTFDKASRRLFTVLLLGSAGVFALGIPGALSQSSGILTDLLFVTDRCVRVASCLLLLFLFLRSHISLKSLSFGIALGYGGFAFINLFIVSMLTGHGVFRQSFLSQLNSSAYLLATLIWLRYVMWARDRDGNPIRPARSAGNTEARSIAYCIVPRGRRLLRHIVDRFDNHELSTSPAACSRLTSVPTSRQ